MKLPRFSLENAVLGGTFLLALLLFRRPDAASGWRAGLLLLIVLSAIPWLSGRHLPWREGDRHVKSLLLGWSGFVAIVLVTALMGETFAVAPVDLARGFLLPAALPFVILTWVRDERNLRLLFIAFFAGAVVLMGRNAGQYAVEWSVAGRFDPNILLHRPYGDGLVFSLPFLFAGAIYLRGKLLGIGCLLLAMVDLLMIAMTGARGAWLAAATIVLLYLVVYRSRGLTIAVSAAIAAVVVGMVTFIPPELGLNRIHQGFDTSLRTTGTWGPALEMIAERPLTGYGYGPEVFHREFNRRAPTAPHWSVQQSMGPHSLFLDIGFSAGVIGLTAFVGTLVALAFRISHHLSCLGRERDRNPFLFLAGIALLGLLMGSIVVQGLVEGRSWPPIGFWLGLSLAWLRLAGAAVLNGKDSA